MGHARLGCDCLVHPSSLVKVPSMRSSATRSLRPLVITTLTGLTVGSLMILGAGPALAATAVDLGTASAFAVIAGSTVTNTGPSVINGDIGLSPGTAVIGFPPGIQATGATYAANPIALQAQADLTTAFTAASGQPDENTTTTELGGQTLTAGIYESGGVFQIAGGDTLTLNGDADDVFIFRSTSTLITGSAATVLLIGEVDACNVYWIVPSSATLGTDTEFVGTILADQSISASTGTTVQGRLLTRIGAVTLDTTTITTPAGCSDLTVNDGTGVNANLAASQFSAAQLAAQAAAAEAARLAALRAAELAATGTDAALPAGFAAVVIIAGVVTLGLRRRRLGTL